MNELINEMLALEKKWRIIFLLSTVLYPVLIILGMLSDAAAGGAVIAIGFVVWLAIFIKYLNCFVHKKNYKWFLTLSDSPSVILDGFQFDEDGLSQDRQIYLGSRGLFYCRLFLILPYTEFAWVYLKETRAKNSITLQEMIVYTKNGKKFNLPCSSELMTFILTHFVCVQAPDVIVGYTEENKKKYFESIAKK